jgi:hypothetical protein
MSLMARKKTTHFNVHRDGEAGKFVTAKRDSTAAIIETSKSDVQTNKFLPILHTKQNLSDAVSKAVKHDAQASKFLTVKEAKKQRRDTIIKTIMRHTR